MDGPGSDSRRSLPALHSLLDTPAVAALLQQHPRAVVAAAMRDGLDMLRRSGQAFDADGFFRDTAATLRRAPSLRRVLNATGVVLHTNLGRAPLAPAALAAIAEVTAGYASLEIDLNTGQRGDRYAACAALLRALTGTEAAIVVNNGAAAMLLAVSALSASGETIVSRGELIEIGGGFRIPEVIVQGGARLIEVGTTNRTRLADYEAAIGPTTRVLLRVHRSNFAVRGFTAMPKPRDLAALARRHGLMAVEDLGSGALVDLSRFGLPREPSLAGSIDAGFDLVVASGDKLLGGPQAGLLLGRAEAIARCARHPLMRALRPDKATLAALEATLRLYQDPDQLAETIPALRMLALTESELLRRADALCVLLPDSAGASVEPGHSLVGGGSLPDARLPTRLVAIAPGCIGAEALAARLRRARPPLVGRIERDRLLLDPRTLADVEIAEAARAITEALR